jgi:ferredoxin--NADP+ reductase
MHMFDDILAKGKSSLEIVVSVHWWTDRLFTFRTSKPPGYLFAAGQYARLGLPDENDVVWRAYSMTSAPGDPELEFYGIVVPNGRFTSQAKTLHAGSPILVEKQSFGFLTPDRFTDGEDLWMLATGTGIGPFISMLRDPYVWVRFRRLLLVHCVRHADEFTYTDELAELADSRTDSGAALQVIRTTTRDQSESCLHGRITTLLQSGELERAAGVPLSETASRLMLCGNPEMIEDTRRLLHERGLRPVRRTLPGQFLTENYW